MPLRLRYLAWKLRALCLVLRRAAQRGRLMRPEGYEVISEPWGSLNPGRGVSSLI